jgi:hypothetical protein
MLVYQRVRQNLVFSSNAAGFDVVSPFNSGLNMAYSPESNPPVLAERIPIKHGLFLWRFSSSNGCTLW